MFLYLFIDESDYFEQSVDNELLHAITAYEEKSNCTTIMVSTTNRPIIEIVRLR